MHKTSTPPACRPEAPTSLRLVVASDDTPWEHAGASLVPTLALATPSRPDPPADDETWGGQPDGDPSSAHCLGCGQWAVPLVTWRGGDRLQVCLHCGAEDAWVGGEPCAG